MYKHHEQTPSLQKPCEPAAGVGEVIEKINGSCKIQQETPVCQCCCLIDLLLLMTMHGKWKTCAVGRKNNSRNSVYKYRNPWNLPESELSNSRGNYKSCNNHITGSSGRNTHFWRNNIKFWRKDQPLVEKFRFDLPMAEKRL